MQVSRLAATRIAPKQPRRFPRKTPLGKPQTKISSSASNRRNARRNKNGKQQPPKKTDQKKPKDQQRGRPGKDVRIAISKVKDSTFEVKHEGGTTGFAVLIGRRVFKPAHVRGKIDHPDLANLRFDRAQDMDLEVAEVPKSMRDLAAKPAAMLDGVYNWKKGTIRVTDNEILDTSGRGAPGDSGSAITDNEGRVVGIILGGGRDGDRTRLSVVSFDKKLKAQEIVYSEATPWSVLPLMLALPAIAYACTFNGTPFDCSNPDCTACCIFSNQDKALSLLTENVEADGYWDLLLAVTDCNSGRQKRGINPTPYDSRVLSAHAVTTPYMSYCPDCGHGGCISPIGIDEVSSSGSNSILRVRTGSQFGVNAKGKAAGEMSLRYLTPEGLAAATDNSRARFSTSARCEILQAIGHYVLVKCPSGNSLTLAVSLDGTRHSCTIHHHHTHAKRFAREKSRGHHLSVASQPCVRYSRVPKKKKNFLVHVYEPLPVTVTVSSVIKCNQSKCVATVPAGHTLSFTKKCKTGSASNESYTSDTNFTCAQGKYTQLTLRGKLPHLMSTGLPKGNTTVAKAAVPYPFPPETTVCRISVAQLPRIDLEGTDLILTGTAPYAVMLTVRNLGFHSNASMEWVTGDYSIRIPISPQGTEIRWGNNEPQHYWLSLKYASGTANAYPWELLIHHIEYHPEWAWGFLALICLLIALSACACSCACKKARYNIIATKFNPTAPPVTGLVAALCCIPGVKAETPYFDIVAYLWTNNKTAFALQFLAPVAAILIVTYIIRHVKLCCKPFLGKTGWLLAIAALVLAQKCTAYEHTITVPMDPKAPTYEAIVDRQGYEPVKLTVTVNYTIITPTTALEYWTCKGEPVVEPPHVGCCKTVTCPNKLRTLDAFKDKATADRHCDVHTHVYPLVWGAAKCFCSTENTQLSAVAATVSEFCEHETERAEAYSVHSSTVSAELEIKFGEHSLNFHAYVDGLTVTQSNGVKLIAGPISTDYTPFDSKVVRLGAEIYNYDWPPYGAGYPGTFGDIQSRATNYKKPGDLYANLGIELLQPSNDHVHVAFTHSSSGLVRWLRDAPKPLSVVAPHGCEIKAKPIVALNCGVGLVPLSINIPDGKFTRKVVDPKPSALSCTVSSCQYGVDYGGAASVTFEGHDNGKCGVHSTTPGVTVMVQVVTVTPGNNQLKTSFSAPNPEVSFTLEICEATTTCAGKCTPPKEHITASKPRHDNDVGSYVSGPAMYWAGGTIAVIVVLVVIGAIIACAIQCHRKNSIRVVKG